jgi:hypothetical protein
MAAEELATLNMAATIYQHGKIKRKIKYLR